MKNLSYVFKFQLVLLFSQRLS